jgi:hypothetical protein
VNPLEGRLVDESVVTILAMRFTKLDDKSRLVIRDIADEANGSISMNPPTERRIGIARILLEIAENDGHVDKDLVRSICELRTGKKYNTAGEALADLSWVDAERVWSSFQDIYNNRVQLEYIPVSNNYIIKEHSNVR